MARSIVYAIIVLMMIETTMFLFGGGAGDSGCNFNSTTEEYITTNGTVGQSSLFYATYCQNNDITHTGWFTTLKYTLLAIGASTLILGTFFSLNIYGIYAGLSAVFFSFLMSFYNFYVFINGSLDGVLDPGIAHFISFLLCMPLIIGYLMIVMEYTRSGS